MAEQGNTFFLRNNQIIRSTKKIKMKLLGKLVLNSLFINLLSHLQQKAKNNPEIKSKLNFRIE